MICERSTKTSELAERLRTELLARRLPSGSPVASVRELASRYGVSTVTADRILNLLVILKKLIFKLMVRPFFYPPTIRK